MRQAAKSLGRAVATQRETSRCFGRAAGLFGEAADGLDGAVAALDEIQTACFRQNALLRTAQQALDSGSIEEMERARRLLLAERSSPGLPS
jgi:hypothetical protein